MLRSHRVEDNWNRFGHRKERKSFNDNLIPNLILQIITDYRKQQIHIRV